jgi:hypothetical protein
MILWRVAFITLHVLTRHDFCLDGMWDMDCGRADPSWIRSPTIHVDPDT